MKKTEASTGVETLFTSALGLQSPWEVVKVELDTSRRRIDFNVLCNAKRLACPACGLAEQGIHDRAPLKTAVFKTCRPMQIADFSFAYFFSK